ncbi:MAG: TlpA family protein disulfide reductase [Firmicutes bacterium]|nr:TlpA family protein disulfide reductase [Bacillota bacterium]
MKKIWISLIILIIVISFSACSKENQETQVNGKNDAEKIFRIPDFNSVDLNGNEVSNDFFASNNLTLVNVWTTTCPSCLGEIPALQEIEEKYIDKGVRVLGILADGEVEKGKVYISQKDAQYINILPTESLITGFLDGIMYVPTALLVDNTGAMIGEIMVGAKSTEEFSKLIDGILE